MCEIEVGGVVVVVVRECVEGVVEGRRLGASVVGVCRCDGGA